VSVCLRGIVLDAMPGDSITEVLQEAIDHAHWPGAPDVFLTFNGVVFLVDKDQTKDQLYAHWLRLMDDESRHFRATHPVVKQEREP